MSKLKTNPAYVKIATFIIFYSVMHINPTAECSCQLIDLCWKTPRIPGQMAGQLAKKVHRFVFRKLLVS